FSDILASHLEMNAAGVDRLGATDGEKAAHLLRDAFSRPRLVASRRFYGVAVHRVADPKQLMALALRGPLQSWQRRLDLVGAESADEREPAGFAFGIEDFDQPDHLIRAQRRAALETDRVLEPTAEFDVGAAELAR